LQTLWRELSTLFPDEFALSPETVVAWRDGRPQYSYAFDRRWLATELAESGWERGQKGDEKLSVGCYLERLSALASHGRQVQAVAAAAALAVRWLKDANPLYGCACVHALAAAGVSGDVALSQRYADQAVELLRQAAEAGYRDTEHMRKDSDLDGLRLRKDFRELLKKLDIKKSKRLSRPQTGSLTTEGLPYHEEDPHETRQGSIRQ
jgi:hypothetical protein